LAKNWHAGDVVLLIGPLGAGKTHFAKGVGKALGIAEEITSPTYAIVNEYPNTSPLIHMDLYRIQGEEDFENIGGPEYFSPENICLIEWPQRALGLIPWTKRVEISILEGDLRQINLVEKED
jgi:tRNA threonylcarbamoyladenosine biosynthesis protein TsaE